MKAACRQVGGLKTKVGLDGFFRIRPWLKTVIKIGIFKQAATWFADLTGKTKSAQMAGARSDLP